MKNQTMHAPLQTGIDNTLPEGMASPALSFLHFPTKFQAVIWRNWDVATPEKLAEVLCTETETILREAAKMGLKSPASEQTRHIWLQRGYLTLIRQNWHLLPYAQLLTLLGWDEAQMAYALKEDDFLWNKLGNLKPKCSHVSFSPLSKDEEARTALIRNLVEERFDALQEAVTERPFDFFKNFEVVNSIPKADKTRHSPFGLKLVYSYSAIYGDPLLDETLNPYPDGLLAELTNNGINGIWLQGVLYTLVPWLGDIEASEGYEKRLSNLNILTERASRFGIRVYLYLNEPRAMPPEFFTNHPDWRGAVPGCGEQVCLCVSNPEIKKTLRTGISDLVRSVPKLGGVFTITMSENPTHCLSHVNRVKECPHCSERAPEDLVAEVNNIIEEGVHNENPNMDVIAWNWAWEKEWALKAIDQLLPKIKLMCTSESYLPTKTMGIDGLVGDYSMSKVGPGPLAVEQWKHASERGLEILGKIQMNNTWECAAVPYIPVPFLVQRHLQSLLKQKVSGLMISWTCGGYPGGNLFLTENEPEEFAISEFGEKSAPKIVEAWKRFGDAFEEFPLHGCNTLYAAPQNYGPMNLLFLQPTNFQATMQGFPYDDLSFWRKSRFTEEVFEAQFQKLSEGWKEGLDILLAAGDSIPEEKMSKYADLLSVSKAVYCHFRSTFLQIRFIRLRGDYGQPEVKNQLIRILDEEIDLAIELLKLVNADARIGFEASNHYYYTRQSLMEKVLNCEDLKNRLQGESASE